MNARCFLLPVILVALFAVSWSPADELPKAPPPHAKKTTAELLVGTWKVVKMDGKETPKDWIDEDTFFADGKWRTRFIEPVQPEVMRFGTYKLDGNTIRLDIQANGEFAARKTVITILSLTEDRLVFVAKSENIQNTVVLQRRNLPPR